MIEDKYLIDKLKKKKLKFLDQIYLNYKNEFYLFAKSYSIADSDISDVYQETIITLYENIQQGKLTKLTSSLKTYLFAIGKNKIYKLLNKSKRLLCDDTLIYVDQEDLQFDVDIDEERQKILEDSFKELGDKCQAILNLYYYEGLSLEEIQGYLEYSSKDVLKSQKSRCMKKLKECVKKRYE